MNEFEAVFQKIAYPELESLANLEPARRHRCEVCLELFECHLCTIESDSRLHSQPDKIRITSLVFVCEQCCEDSHLNRYQIRHSGKGYNGSYGNYRRDMLTGERLPL